MSPVLIQNTPTFRCHLLKLCQTDHLSNKSMSVWKVVAQCLWSNSRYITVLYKYFKTSVNTLNLPCKCSENVVEGRWVQMSSGSDRSFAQNCSHFLDNGKALWISRPDYTHMKRQGWEKQTGLEPPTSHWIWSSRYFKPSLNAYL